MNAELEHLEQKLKEIKESLAEVERRLHELILIAKKG